MKMKNLKEKIKKEIKRLKTKYEDWDLIVLDAFNFTDGCYTLTHYSSFPDGRSGDILSVHFKIDNKYYCCMVYDENLINLKEISKEIYEKDSPF